MLWFDFYSYWLGDGFALNIRYYLRRTAWQSALGGPTVFSLPTYAAIPALSVMLGALAVCVRDWLAVCVKSKRLLMAAPVSWAGYTALFDCVFWSYGLLISVIASTVYPHYLIMLYPLPHVFAAFALRGRKGLFLALCLAELTISLAFLQAVRHGLPESHGEYGIPYHLQTPGVAE